MPYKILMVTMGLDIGGAETHIVELSKQLQSMGYEVVVVSNGGVYVPEITAAGIRHYAAPLHRRSVSCMWKSLNILRRVIRDERPDVVHTHARIPAFLCDLLHPFMRFPFVATAHWVFDTGGILRWLTRWGQRTVAVSDDIREYLIREYGVPREHIRVTINGIDTEKFSPAVSGRQILAEFGLDSAAPVVSYVSRMDEDRALAARHLIQITPELARRFPDIQVLIAGGGNVFDQLLTQAEEVNRQLGRRAVVMTGPRTDINEIAAAGDVFVGVSRSALEAMSAGKPVIVAGNEGYHGLFGPEKLEQAMLGNFCCRGLEQCTPERLLEDLSAALALPEADKRALGEYGRQVILQHYSVRRMAQDCLDMYDQVRRKKSRVLMSGYYGFSNAGDDAILQSIRDNILSASRDISVTVLSSDPALTSRCYGMPALHRFRLFQVLKAVKNCDVLISGGGSLLQDRTSSRSLLYYLAVIRLARTKGKKVMFYANGIGPVTRPANRRRVRDAVEQADLVTLRDHSSLAELREMGVTRTDLQVTADPVFTMECAPRERVDAILRQAGAGEAPFAVISVRPWPTTEGFPAQLAKLCDHLHHRYGLTCLFMLMQPKRDLEVSLQVAARTSCPLHILEGSFTPPELMGVIARSRLCVAMRLHTIIFAAKVAVPVMGLVYDPKVAGYLEELGMPSAGNVSAFHSSQAIAQVDALMSDYDERKAQLARRSQALTQAARENERLLLQLLEE